MADEGPYPSIVTGAVPLGAPGAVACAAAGVRTAKPQIVAAESAAIKMDFIGNSFGWILPRTLDRAAKTRCFSPLFRATSSIVCRRLAARTAGPKLSL